MYLVDMGLIVALTKFEKLKLADKAGQTLSIHTCDKFKKGIKEIFFSFQGAFSKMYRIYRKIVNSFQEDFLIL